MSVKANEDPRSYLVVQANEFIRHPRTDKLTAKEANIAYYLISRIKKGDKDFMTVHFTVNEFCRICGDDEGNGKNYRGVKNALKSLADKSAWVKSITENGKVATTLVRWVDTYTIVDGDGTVTATLSQSIKPYLLELTEHFTQSELRNYLALKSVYSKRLYEILRSYTHSRVDNSGRYIVIEFETEELKKLLNAENYGRYKDFRVNVLDRAKKEINAVTDIEMDYTPVKTGRAVTRISFTVKLKDSFERFLASAQANEAIDKA